MTKEGFPGFTAPASGPFEVESFKAAGLRPVSPEEARRLSLETPAAATPESREEFEGVLQREREKLFAFFGYDIEVPPIPDSVTPEQYEKWKQMGHELHYLPEEPMTKDKEYPGWKKKPTSTIDLFAAMNDKSAKMAPDTLELPGSWVLVDTRKKPTYKEGNQMYEDDTLMAKALEELRAAGIIPDYRKKGSRFNISWEELQKPEVRAKIAEMLDVDPDSIRLPKAIEANFLGNAHYPAWGNTNTWEWFNDTYQGRGHLVGGDSDSGGLSDVGWARAGDRDDRIGFRPLVVVS